MIKINDSGIFVNDNLVIPFNYTQLITDITNKLIENNSFEKYYFTYGEVLTINRRTQIGGAPELDFNHNYADIFPPENYTIKDLVAFIPSIATIYYNGDVNWDDITYCRYKILDDRIRVIANNSENRKNSKINYLAIWRKQ